MRQTQTFRQSQSESSTTRATIGSFEILAQDPFDFGAEFAARTRRELEELACL